MLPHLAFIECCLFTDHFYNSRSLTVEESIQEQWPVTPSALMALCCYTEHIFDKLPRQGSKYTFFMKRYAWSLTVTNFLGQFWYFPELSLLKKYFWLSIITVGLIWKQLMETILEEVIFEEGLKEGWFLLLQKRVEIFICKLSDYCLGLVLGSWWIWEGCLASLLIATKEDVAIIKSNKQIWWLWLNLA